jgi:hypothetical protein
MKGNGGGSKGTKIMEGKCKGTKEYRRKSAKERKE